LRLNAPVAGTARVVGIVGHSSRMVAPGQASPLVKRAARLSCAACSRTNPKSLGSRHSRFGGGACMMDGGITPHGRRHVLAVPSHCAQME
jgi:hypothetical protein